MSLGDMVCADCRALCRGPVVTGVWTGPRPASGLVRLCVLLYGILNPDYFTTGGMAHERGRVLEACRVTFQHSESYITKFAP